MTTATKICPCIVCGAEVEVTKFASASKVKCELCKNGGSNTEATEKPIPDVQQSFGGLTHRTGPRIDGQPSKALRNLCCPHHPDKPMTVIGVNKSELWGDQVTLQCREKECYTVVVILERQQFPLRTKVHGDGYEPDDIIEALANDEIREFFK